MSYPKRVIYRARVMNGFATLWKRREKEWGREQASLAQL